jgi:hypothetical protein
MRNLLQLGVHALLLADTTRVIIARTLRWEVTHGERRQQYKDQGVQNQTTELGGTLAGCDPAAKDIAGSLVCRGACDQSIKNGWDNIKFGSVGHFLFTQNKIHQA